LCFHLYLARKNRYNKRTIFRSLPVAYNPYIVVPFATWAVAQITKFALAAFRGKIDFRYLYASGGMPSVHSAVVCALATTALLVDGADSHLFGFAVILAAIVMYDSFGVRRSSGEQAAAINMLIVGLNNNRVKFDRPIPHLREILGHQPREVAVGALFGVLLACLFNYDRLGVVTGFVQTVPGRPEVLTYFGVFGLLVVAGWITRFVMRLIYRKSKVITRLSKRMLALTQTVGWLGLVSAVLVYEHASYFAWRLWPVLLLTVGVLWAAWLAADSYKTVPTALVGEANEARKLKWLRWGRDKKRKAKRA
jgi:acid phosphatase family membrane protein YuiD